MCANKGSVSFLRGLGTFIFLSLVASTSGTIGMLWGTSFSSLGFLLTSSLLGDRPSASSTKTVFAISILLISLASISFHASLSFIGPQNFTVFFLCVDCIASLVVMRTVNVRRNLTVLIAFTVLYSLCVRKQWWLTLQSLVPIIFTSLCLKGLFLIDSQVLQRPRSLFSVFIIAFCGFVEFWYTEQLVSSVYTPFYLFMIGVLGGLVATGGGRTAVSLYATCGLSAGLLCSLFFQPVNLRLILCGVISPPFLLLVGNASAVNHLTFSMPSRDLSFPYHSVGVLQSFLANNRERKLFLFLLLTVGVMLLELFYGIRVNSLGLISDSFHMMLDSASIVIGLCAAHASTWQATEKWHAFGYGRYEVLGGFVNGVLLLFIALFVMVESAERILDPPKIDAPYLLLVSGVGLLVNIVGLLFFHDSHHGHSHSHSHDSGCTSSVDHNIKGVYLHILADLLGSVSVILSSGLIYFFNSWIADPICTVISATLILLSALPLIEETGKILLLWAPDSHSNASEDVRRSVEMLGITTEIELPKVWMHSTTPRELLICTISAKLKQNQDYSSCRTAVYKTAHEILKKYVSPERAKVVVHLE